MLRTAAGLLLVAGVLPVCFADVARSQGSAETDSVDGSALIDQTTLPTAVDLKGSRPQADPSVLPPAATTLPESMESLQAPPNHSQPDQTDQVRIRELRPLTLAEVEQFAEVNNPNLKAVASQVQQAKSGLRLRWPASTRRLTSVPMDCPSTWAVNGKILINAARKTSIP